MHPSGLLALVALGPAAALAAVAPRASSSANNAWVTVDGAGNVATVTPTGTASAPPSSLTHTSAYVLSLGGHAVTTTAAPPFATATGPGTAGTFLVCDRSKHGTAGSPFCQPAAGSILTPNRTYYITWDPSTFAASQMIELETQYANGDGFATARLAASSGFYAWTVDSSFVAEHGASRAVNVTFYLAYNTSASEGDGNLLRIGGPSVLVSQSPPPTVRHGPAAGTVAGIVVAVVLSIFAVLLSAFCVWSYRHHGRLPCIGALVSKRASSFSAKGYGVRQSYGDRTGSGAWAAGGQGAFAQPLPTLTSASPGGGGNVFRAELKRQEEEQERRT